MSIPSDTCTLVWPIERDAGGAVLDVSAGRSAWLVGWNPRGLSVVVCGFLYNMPHAEALERLGKIKAALRDYSPLYRSLHVLGSIESMATTASAFLTRQVSTVDGDKARSLARQSEDVWLQLQPGPTLGEVWCCGYRVHGCQLHVIRCNPNKRYAVSPDVFSPTALYGPGGVRQLLEGKAPLCVRGALSSLEGVLLPKVMEEESAPVEQAKANLNDLLKTTSIADRGELLASFVDDPDETGTLHCEYSGMHGGNNASTGNNASMGDAMRSTMDSFCVPDSARFQPLVAADSPLEPLPPSLDFPTSTKNYSEMSALLRLCYTGINVSRVIDNKTPRKLKEEPSEMSRLPESSRLCETTALNETSAALIKAATRLLLLVLKVETAIAPFSFVAQTLEVRTRELINFFSMILGKTNTCGLHPVLPHKESAASFHVCVWSFLVRMLVDLLLGMSLYVCFRSLFHHKVDSFPFYFLYDVHMSYMEWFAGWPAGFKTNEDVNKVLCFCSTVLLTLWNLVARGGIFLRVAAFGGTMAFQDSVLTAMQDAISVANYTCSTYNYQYSNVTTTVSFSLADRHPEVYVWLDFGVLLTCACGASVALAAFADVTRLATLHLTILFGIFSTLYAGVLSLIGSLSQLFRGLKYNPLRRRVDGHEFQTDQMLFASFFLVVVCSLLPAVSVYYFYFMLMRLFIWVISLFFVNMGYIVLYLPTFEVLYWFCRRRTLVGSLYMSTPCVTMTRHLTAAASRESCTVQTVDMSLCTSPLPLYYMLTDFLVIVRILLKNVFPKKMIVGSFTGNMEQVRFNTVEQLVPHLVADPENPTCTYLKFNQEKNKTKK